MYIRLGVAGFIFGNTMMFSFPEYLGAGTEAGLKDRVPVAHDPVLPAGGVLPQHGLLQERMGRASVRDTVNIDQPIALGIVALWTRSLWEVITGVGPGYFDSLAGCCSSC
jgi:Cu+-exporting ATPase